MAISYVSNGYGVSTSQAGASWRREIADLSFAKLLQADRQAVGNPLTPATTQPASETKPKAAEHVAEKKQTPADLFLEYMKKSPAQRWHESWLKQHKLSEEEFAALPPEKRQALEEQMARDMQEQIRQTAEKKAADTTLI